MRFKEYGLTMVEALTTLGIVGVIASISAPALSGFMEDAQLRTDTSDLFTSLLVARSEAVKRNSVVTLCTIDTASPNDCDSSESWQSGWMAFEDDDADGVRDGGEEVLLTHTGMQQNTSVTSVSFADDLRYFPSGTVSASGSLNICVNGVEANEILINATGRPRIVEAVCP